MKLKTLSAIAVLLLAYNQSALAGTYTIPKTYANGDILTFTDLNAENAAIKAAVDGNDSAITALKSGIYSVTAVISSPRNSACPTNQYNAGGMVGRYAANATCGSEFLVAPVSIPNGATVTRFTCTVFDADATYDSSCYLYPDDGTSALAVVSTTGATGIQNLSTTSISNAIINNSTTGYYVYLGINGTAASNLTPIRVTVEYTLP